MRVRDEFEFEASSPVGRYWLIHAVDFTVCREDGRKLGVVEDVVVDPVRLRAEQLIVRRSGLALRRRRAAIDADSVAAVVPASQVLLVEPAPRRAKRRSLTRQVLRRLAAGLVVAGRLCARGASAGALAAVAAARRGRREAPKLGRWMSVRTRSTGRVTLRVLRVLGGFARIAASRLAAAARIAARVLGELAVLVVVLAAAAWRWAAALSTPRKPSPDEGPDATQWQSDADAALGREMQRDDPTRSGARRRIADAAAERRPDR